MEDNEVELPSLEELLAIPKPPRPIRATVIDDETLDNDCIFYANYMPPHHDYLMEAAPAVAPGPAADGVAAPAPAADAVALDAPVAPVEPPPIPIGDAVLDAAPADVPDVAAPRPRRGRGRGGGRRGRRGA